MNKKIDKTKKDKVIDYRTIMLDGEIEHVPNPLYLPIEIPTEECRYCFMADWYEFHGCMVYCCDLSHCIFGDGKTINY